MTVPATWPELEAKIQKAGTTEAMPPPSPPWQATIGGQQVSIVQEPPPFQLALKATGETFELGTLPDDRLRLLRPLTVRIEKEAEQYVAACEDIEEYGCARDPMGAVDDLRLSVTELYWELKADRHRLAPALRLVWERLQEIVQER